MDVQRVERIADFVRHAGRQQRQRLDPLAFDGFKRFLPRLGGIVQNQRHAGTALRLAVQRRGVKAQKTRARIAHFKFVMRDAVPPVRTRRGETSPIPVPAETPRSAVPPPARRSNSEAASPPG